MLKDYDLKELVVPLRDWFEKNARKLPWRDDPRPYYVWISEIMLQQTRVEAVKPYFSRFISALPDVYALASCDEDTCMKLWEGLGYYSRVRNLHAAAVQIVEDYDGVIPREFEELLKLKGVGRYTAGAIASLAYERPVPAVDGNVLRVLTRVSNDDTDIMSQGFRRETENRLKELMEEVCPAVITPRVFNQGLMELGALVCVPNGEPHCPSCPWSRKCLARKLHTEKILPCKKSAPKRREEERTVLKIRCKNMIAIQKRPEKGLLAGLYEFPNLPGHLSEEEVLSMAFRMGYTPIRIRRLRDSVHVFSHVQWNMTAYELEVEETDPEKDTSLLFVDEKTQKESFALPSAFSAYKTE